jgi:phosphoglycerate dehydrogenase-like enzyme
LETANLSRFDREVSHCNLLISLCFVPDSDSNKILSRSKQPAKLRAMKVFSIGVTRRFDHEAQALLESGMGPHQLVFENIGACDIAFGQPDVQMLIDSPTLQWAHISSAGYTPYDNSAVRAALKARGAILTNSSHVYDEPCAQHALAMILAHARQLPQCWNEKGEWHSGARRADSFLLNEQTILLLGFGAIGERLAQLLAPFDMNVVALRRHARGNENVRIIGESELQNALAQADHIVNILLESDATRGFVSRERLAQTKRGAIYYSIGRGATTEQEALIEFLASGHLGAAYLDVTTPEPLPPQHPLWSAPNCFLTPHTAGGHKGEEIRLVQHFLSNLRAFETGKPLRGVVIP